MKTNRPSIQNSLLAALLLSLGIVFPSASARAETSIVVSFSETAPDTNVEFSDARTSGSSQAWRNTAANQIADPGQIFTTGDTGFALDKFTVQIQTGPNYYAQRAALVNAAFEIRLLAFGSPPSAGGLTLSPLANTLLGSGIINKTYAELQTEMLTDRYMTFDLDTPLQLSPNTTYGIVLHFLETNPDRRLELHIAYGSAGSRTLFTGNGTNYTSTTNSLTYWIQSAPSQIPEPSSYALIMAFAGTALLCWRIRRRR